MTHYIGESLTPRYSLKIYSVPTYYGSSYRAPIDYYTPESYKAILDCVYEMTDMVTTSNGVSVEQALSTVLADEGWHILPSHKKMIVKRLED